jgi:hypothetical protein
MKMKAATTYLIIEKTFGCLLLSSATPMYEAIVAKAREWLPQKLQNEIN